jgi:hypothetical protein
LLLLSPLVILPLALRRLANDFTSETDRNWLARLLVLQLPTAVPLVIACEMPPSWLSSLLCVPWLAFTVGVSALGLRRLWPRAEHSWVKTCHDSGLIFLAIGGIWLCIWRSGWRPLDFPEVIVMLTAIHFHFAGPILPWLAAWSSRAAGPRLASVTTALVVISLPLLAVGISATHLGWPPHFEMVAAMLVSCAGGLTALLQMRWVISPGIAPVARLLAAISGITLLIGMILAALYGLRFLHGWEWLDIPWMRVWHGTANAIGACGCGVLAHRQAPAAHAEQDGHLLSRMSVVRG